MADAYSSTNRGQVEARAPNLTPDAVIVAGIVVAGLYLGRDVLVPFVLAVLLSFVLAIPAKMLQGLGLGRRFPIAIVVLIAFATIFTVTAVLGQQLTELAGELPSYQSTIRKKISALKGTASGHGPLERLIDMVQGLSEEVSRQQPNASTQGGATQGATQDKPLPVEIVTTRTSPLDTLSNYLTPILHPLTTAGLVAIFTIFMLLQRGDLRNRAIRLAGSHDLQRTTAAMNDAAQRLARFFLAQVLLNAGFGVAVGLGLWTIGVPSPILWGILAAISRFVPYVGVVLAAGGPLILAAAVDPNWTMLAFTAAFFASAELLVGQVIEPILYGHSTGLSPVAVVVSVTFWTWLWGPVGLLLATPLTVCLVVLGRHVERLEFLDVMLGDRPPLTVAESFYQRLLAGDTGEAVEQAEDFLRAHPALTFYDAVAIKGLALAQVDLARGALDEARLERVSQTMSELIEVVSEHEEGGPDAKRPADPKRAAGDEDLDSSLEEADSRSRELPVLDPARLPAGWTGEVSVLCIAGRNALDQAGAAMLAQSLGRHGLKARVEGAEELTSANVARWPDPDVRVICLSYLDTSSPAHARYAVRRIRRRLPDAKVIVGMWGIESEAAKGVCEAARSDTCASRLIEAVGFCLDEAVRAGAVPRQEADSAPAGAGERAAGETTADTKKVAAAAA